MQLADALPTVNAALNGTAAVLLVAGFLAARRRRYDLHRRLMLAAFSASVLFLISYLTRVALTGTHRYPGTGVERTIYLAILGSHTVLAAVAVPIILRTLQLSLLKRQFSRHKTLGRIALPVWLYVSLTGVAVYLMLYRFAGA